MKKITHGGGLLFIGTGILLASLANSYPSLANAEPMPSQEEMWKMIQAQQQQIEELKAQVKMTDEKADAVTEVVESQSVGITVAQESIRDEEKTNLQQSRVGSQGNIRGNTGTAATASFGDSTQIGGYGELHYNGGDKDEIDFHRFVLFFNHQFNERMRLFSEFELEHTVSGDDQDGTTQLEQAYLEFDINENHRAQTGIFLMPVGLINEVHEPTTFFGVERNPVETNIIPTTWWEAGAGLKGELPLSFQYDAAIHSGLEVDTEGSNAFKIRNGRQKVAEASAKDGAATARLRWNGVPGITLGGSAQYQNDITQDTFEEEISAVLLTTSADIRKGPLGLRALYANWNLDGDAPELIGRDQQQGWYVEPGYYIDTKIGTLGFFSRYNQYNNEAGAGSAGEYEQYDVGLNYWPHPGIVLKADMAFVKAPAGGNDDNILNLGVGYNF